MTLSSPEIQNKLFQWQSELRQLVGNEHIQVQAFYPLKRYEPIETVADIVCQETNVGMDLIRKKTRKRYVVIARHLICFFGRKCTRLSLTEIGNFIGGRDHTTVIHGGNHIKDMLDTRDPEISEYVAKITVRLEEKGQDIER